MKHEDATKSVLSGMLLGMISNLYGYLVQSVTAAGSSTSTGQNSSVVPTGMATKSSGVTPMLKNNKTVTSKRISMAKTSWINNIVRGINRR